MVFRVKKVKCESLVHKGSSGARQVPSRRILQCVCVPLSWGVNISRAPCIGLMKTSQKGSGWKTNPHPSLSEGLITGQFGWASTHYEVMLKPCNIQQRPHCVSELGVFFSSSLISNVSLGGKESMWWTVGRKELAK